MDDRLPCLAGRLCFSRCQREDVFWLPLLEKAYAKYAPGRGRGAGAGRPVPGGADPAGAGNPERGLWSAVPTVHSFPCP